LKYRCIVNVNRLLGAN